MELAPTASERPRYRVPRDGILDAATVVFARDGFERANMDTIASRAGVTKPTLYSRFGSKEGLFAEAVKREYELRKDRLFEAYGRGSERPFGARLADWNTAFFNYVGERPEGFKLISEGERHPAAAPIVEQVAHEITGRIEELIGTVSARQGRGAHLLATMIAGMLTACAREALTAEVDLDQAAALCESFLAAALRGIDPDLLGVRPGR